MATLSPDPVANNSAARTGGLWHADPTFRGTWGIVSTCYSTLVICIWSCLHVNITIRYQEWSIRDKLRWLLVGFLAPDILILKAFLERVWVQKLSSCAEVLLPADRKLPSSRLCGWWHAMARYTRRKKNVGTYDQIESHDVSDPDLAESGNRETTAITPRNMRKNTWTTTHSHYAAMGGFVLDSSQIPVFGIEDRLALTPNKVLFLMKHAPDLIPDMPEGQITYQSQSSALAKSLLTIQLLYFALSCVARVAQRLPLSLLEVWTLSHTLAALWVYVLWWTKPLDIAEPTVISGGTTAEFAAYIQMVSQPVIHSGWLLALWRLRGTSEMSYLEITPCENTGDARPEEPPVRVLQTGESIRLEGYSFTLRRWQPNNVTTSVCAVGGTASPWYARKGNTPDGTVSLSEADIQRWRLAARCASRLPNGWDAGPTMYIARSMGLDHSETDVRLDGANGAAGLVLSGTYVLPAIVLFPAVVSYTLPHLIGWNADFPGPLDRSLWRIASVMVLTVPASYGVLHVLRQSMSAAVRSDHPKVVFTRLSIAGIAVYACSMWLSWLLIVIYVLANGCLFVESIRQLSRLPDKAFLVPDFAVYFPHFS